MSEAAATLAPVQREHYRDMGDLVDRTRYNFLQLQALITVVLSYQLLFSPNPILSGDAQLLAILGLMSLCGSIIALPASIIGASWFPGILAIVDTGITTVLIYLSGEASSDLYLTYFVIILLATLTRTAAQMLIFIVLVSTMYAVGLYLESTEGGIVLENHIMRIPLLMIMAIFYSRTVDSVRNLTNYDPLTNLPNRRQFLEHLTERLSQGKPDGQQYAVLYLDLDGFNLINETLGHHVGDQLLIEVTSRLTFCLRKSDTVARLGGDEFAILLTNVTSVDDVSLLAQRILGSLAPAFELGGGEVYTTASMGIALYPQDAKDADNLVKYADAALNTAKSKGKNLYQFFSADMNAQARERLILRSRLGKAVERNELLVHYQPQIELRTGRTVGVEALLRWKQPELGMVMPGQFIPFAEETGLIVPIGQWVLQAACRQMCAWQVAGVPPIELSVNLSARQFRQTDLVRMVARTLEETGLDPHCLELEITESTMIEDAQLTQHTLRELKNLGLRLAIDDFGTGYASLIYLTKFPVDTIKIDRSFIQGIPHTRDAGAIVSGIIAMGRALNLRVIAEGAEHGEQASFLREQGCDAVQGYFYSEAVSPEHLDRLFRQWPSPPAKQGEPAALNLTA